MVTAGVLVAELLPLPPDLGDLVERRVADGEGKAALGQARVKKFEHGRRKNDRLVGVVNHLDLVHQVVALHVGLRDLEVRQVGFGSDHRPVEALGCHRAKVDPAAGADVET